MKCLQTRCHWFFVVVLSVILLLLTRQTPESNLIRASGCDAPVPNIRAYVHEAQFTESESWFVVPHGLAPWVASCRRSTPGTSFTAAVQLPSDPSDKETVQLSCDPNNVRSSQWRSRQNPRTDIVVYSCAGEDDAGLIYQLTW